MQYFLNFSNKVKNLNRFVTNPISPNNNYNNNINKAESITYQQQTILKALIIELSNIKIAIY